MALDWKDALAGLKDAVPVDDTSDTQPEPEPVRKGTQKIHVALEKKGRKGKTATIIYGFNCSDAELEEIAATLKKKIGTGGSARGGEILIQGDWQERVKELLPQLYPNLTI